VTHVETRHAYRGGRRFRGGHHEIRDRDDYHHGFRGGVFLYDPAYAYLYAQSGYWYLCPTANAYYPNIPSCPVPWQLVPAR
jgi:hypothetical protein